MHNITWEDFDQDFGKTQHSPDQVLRGINDEPLADGDMIWLTEAAAPWPDKIEVVLKLGGKVTWWKEVKAIGRDGKVIGRVERDKGTRNPRSFVVSLADLDRLVFSKAKFLGSKTEMYSVGNPQQKAGRKLQFSWDKD